jgi:hypothetical protein
VEQAPEPVVEKATAAPAAKPFNFPRRPPPSAAPAPAAKKRGNYKSSGIDWLAKGFCKVDGCSNPAEPSVEGGPAEYCGEHGGGIHDNDDEGKCKMEGCAEPACEGSEFCAVHGGAGYGTEHQCKVDECSNECEEHDHGFDDFCADHGGGCECRVDGCSNRAEPSVEGGAALYCVEHGGGVDRGHQCAVEGCETVVEQDESGQHDDFCPEHGGGCLCKKDGCSNRAEPSVAGGVAVYCPDHGGGIRDAGQGGDGNVLVKGSPSAPAPAPAPLPVPRGKGGKDTRDRGGSGGDQGRSEGSKGGKGGKDMGGKGGKGGDKGKGGKGKGGKGDGKGKGVKGDGKGKGKGGKGKGGKGKGGKGKGQVRKAPNRFTEQLLAQQSGLNAAMRDGSGRVPKVPVAFNPNDKGAGLVEFDESLVQDAPEPVAFTLEASEFKQRKVTADAKHFFDNTPRHMQRVFENDWALTKIERLIKDPTDLARVKVLMREDYPEVLH